MSPFYIEPANKWSNGSCACCCGGGGYGFVCSFGSGAGGTKLITVIVCYSLAFFLIY